MLPGILWADLPNPQTLNSDSGVTVTGGNNTPGEWGNNPSGNDAADGGNAQAEDAGATLPGGNLGNPDPP